MVQQSQFLTQLLVTHSLLVIIEPVTIILYAHVELNMHQICLSPQTYHSCTDNVVKAIYI